VSPQDYASIDLRLETSSTYLRSPDTLG
jgi:hypothetical protein